MDALWITKKLEAIKNLEKELVEKSIIANETRTSEISQKIAYLKKETQKFIKLQKEIDELLEFINLGEYSFELEKEVSNLQTKLKELELESFLKGKYDKGNAILSIYAGQGGIDAEDWVRILYHMYQKFARNKNWQLALLDSQPNDQGGFKHISFLIKGEYSYGLLKNEAGVHRLIRISPFSPQKLRHTSFALVEVLPEFKESSEFKIDPDQIHFEFKRASGSGGQNVNMRETAVRVVHIPTGLAASSQVERYQARNKEMALKLLYSKLLHLREIEHIKEIDQLKTKARASWGNQIRTYVFDPYKQVKDHRTKLQIKNLEEVLEGGIEEFINAMLIKKLNRI